MSYVRAQAFKIKPGYVSTQMMSMSSDVNQDHRAANACGIEPPSGRHILRGQISLNILKMKLADGADPACADHRWGLAHHRICSVGVGKAELEPGCPDLTRKIYRRSKIRR